MNKLYIATHNKHKLREIEQPETGSPAGENAGSPAGEDAESEGSQTEGAQDAASDISCEDIDL